MLSLQHPHRLVINSKKELLALQKYFSKFRSKDCHSVTDPDSHHSWFL